MACGRGLDPAAVSASRGLLVVGVGNPLREDDGVGIVLVRRLHERYGERLATRELFTADLGLAEELAEVEELLVVDALAKARPGKPFVLEPLSAGPVFHQGGALVSHTFEWPFVLAAARDLIGHAPRAQVLGISGARFGLSEELSPECTANAEAAFAFLCDYVDRP